MNSNDNKKEKYNKILKEVLEEETNSYEINQFKKYKKENNNEIPNIIELKH